MKLKATDTDQVFANHEAQIIKIQKAFEEKCDSIQLETEKLLEMVAIDDKIKRTKILDRHKEKLKKALDTLHRELDNLNKQTDKEIAKIEEEEENMQTLEQFFATA